MAAARAKLPDFFGIGPGRTGTTWLDQVMRGYVDLPEGVKETEFFNHFYDKGIDWYARHFRNATGERKVAEICPYFIYPEARERIKLHMPNCKLIVTLRNPVDHLYSGYKLLRHFVWARGSFEEVLAKGQLDPSTRYASNLKGWFDAFGRENVVVSRYEDLRGDPQRYLDRIADFVGIARIPVAGRTDIGDEVNAFARAPKSRRLARNARNFRQWLKGRQAYSVVNVLERAGAWNYCFGRGEPFPALSPELELKIIQRVTPEIDALQDLLRIDFADWKKPRTARVKERAA